jgi:hypothetical protein
VAPIEAEDGSVGGFSVRPVRRYREGSLVAVVEPGKWNERSLREIVEFIPPAGDWSPFYQAISNTESQRPYARIRFRVTREGQLEVITQPADPPQMSLMVPIFAEFVAKVISGLEEQVQVLTIEELAAKGVDAAAIAQEAGYSRAVLVPADGGRLKPEPLTLELFAHATVAPGAMSVLPENFTLRGVPIRIPSDDAEAANARLQQAAAASAEGRFVLIALDPAYRGMFELPEEHPLALMLSPSTYHMIDRTALAAFLARHKGLQNLILDLTKGSIQTVTIDGKDYFAIFA